MFLFDDYPKQPPQFVAPYLRGQRGEEPFLHLNIDLAGHVCMLANQTGEQYYEQTTLADLL